MAPRKAQDGLTTNGRVGLGGEGGQKGRPYRRRVGRGWVLDGRGRVWDAATTQEWAGDGRGVRREKGRWAEAVLGLMGDDATPGLPGAAGSRLRTPG